MKTFLLALMSALSAGVCAAELIGVSIPENSMDSPCYPWTDGVWSVSGSPLNVTAGIGWLVNPTMPMNQGEFGLHDHVYRAPHVPDPNRSVITLTFDAVVRVKGLRVVQHTNGITRIHGWAGNSLGSLADAGDMGSSLGDPMGESLIPEFTVTDFDFSTSAATGSIFQAVISKTSLIDGYAAYRILPSFEAVPEPTSMAGLLASLLLIRRRRR